MEILRKGISYFLCAKLSQAEICTCGDFSLARPHHFEEMPVWWNGIHSGLRNRGGSMRVQVSPQVLCAKHTEYACNPCLASIGYASHNASSRCSDCRLLRNR